MRAPKISAVILSGFIRFALLIFSIIFRPKNLEHGEVQMEDCFRHRSFRKWLSVIVRIVPLGIFLYTYSLWIMEQRDCVVILLHVSHFVLSIPSYLWIYGLQLFQKKALLQLVNRIHRLFRRVRSLALQQNDGFGGKREMVLIILVLLSQVLEVVLYFELYNPNDIVGWLSLSYVMMCCHLGIRVHILWYLHVGVLYSEVNDYVRHKVKHLRNPQSYQILIGQLEESLSLYREIYDITSRFQAMFNLSLLMCLMQYLLHFAVFSYELIIHINLGDPWIWSGFLRIIFEFLLITLSVEGAGNQFNGVRQIQFEMCCFDENKDFQRLVEVFATELNLYAFRVRLLDLCDVSKEVFLQILSGIVAYLIFIAQCVLQMKQSLKSI